MNNDETSGDYRSALIDSYHIRRATPGTPESYMVADAAIRKRARLSHRSLFPPFLGGRIRHSHRKRTEKVNKKNLKLQLTVICNVEPIAFKKQKTNQN